MISTHVSVSSPRSLVPLSVVLRRIEERLGPISERSIRNYAESGVLPAVKLHPGGRWWFDSVGVDRWITDRLQTMRALLDFGVPL